MLKSKNKNIHIILINKWKCGRDFTYTKCPHSKRHVLGLWMSNPIYVGNDYCCSCQYYVTPTTFQAICREILLLFKIGIVWCSCDSQDK